MSAAHAAPARPSRHQSTFLGLLIAISLTVPLFLVHREWKLARLDPGSPAGAVRRADLYGLGALALVCTAYAIVALRS